MNQIKKLKKIIMITWKKKFFFQKKKKQCNSILNQINIEERNWIKKNDPKNSTWVKPVSMTNL
jgi:uncharacterized FlgJ-related protein